MLKGKTDRLNTYGINSPYRKGVLALTNPVIHHVYESCSGLSAGRIAYNINWVRERVLPRDAPSPEPQRQFQKLSMHASHVTIVCAFV